MFYVGMLLGAFVPLGIMWLLRGSEISPMGIILISYGLGLPAVGALVFLVGRVLS